MMREPSPYDSSLATEIRERCLDALVNLKRQNRHYQYIGHQLPQFLLINSDYQ